MARKLIIILFSFISSEIFSDSVSIMFLGDTYFGESYLANPKYSNSTGVTEEYDYFFENVKDLLAGPDYTIANLETSLHPYSKELYGRKPYSHWSYGDKTCEYLVKYGIDAVSIGNNHLMDYGHPGFTETINLLKKNNISYFGGGENSEKASMPLIKSFGRFKIAVVGGFEYRASYDTLYNFYAESNKPGVYKLELEHLKQNIRTLKLADPSLYLVFFPHWGKNYKQAMEYQAEMAHSLIDAGVDLVIGHGAHTVQEVEYYNGKWIIYNIGNFIFNAPGRYKSSNAKPYGLMAELKITGSSKALHLYPVFTNNLQNNYRLRFLNRKEFDDCYNTVNKNKIPGLSHNYEFMRITL